MQASVVAGIMAGCNELSLSRSLKVSSTMSCDEQLEEAQREVQCLCEERVPQPKGQSASRPERLVTQPCPSLSFFGVLPPPLLSSFVFPCWFPGSCLEAGVRSSHSGHPRVSQGGCAASP